MTASCVRDTMSSLGFVHGGDAGFDVEDGGVGVGEEFFVERADGFFYIFFVDHEAHVDFAGALRDHAHVDVRDGGEDLAGDAGVAADVFADEADERLVAFVLDVGDLAEVVADGGEGFAWSRR